MGTCLVSFTATAEEEVPMYVLPHDLDHEFPEYSSLIHDLASTDRHAAVLFEQYERLNSEIVDIEQNDRVYQDLEFENMKKERLRLKDEIYQELRAHRR